MKTILAPQPSDGVLCQFCEEKVDKEPEKKVLQVEQDLTPASPEQSCLHNHYHEHGNEERDCHQGPGGHRVGLDGVSKGLVVAKESSLDQGLRVEEDEAERQQEGTQDRQVETPGHALPPLHLAVHLSTTTSV